MSPEFYMVLFHDSHDQWEQSTKNVVVELIVEQQKLQHGIQYEFEQIPATD